MNRIIIAVLIRVVLCAMLLSMNNVAIGAALLFAMVIIIGRFIAVCISEDKELLSSDKPSIRILVADFVVSACVFYAGFYIIAVLFFASTLVVWLKKEGLIK